MTANELAIESMCTLAGVSRRGFYRCDSDANLPNAICICGMRCNE
jgi:hypothetical protein